MADTIEQVAGFEGGISNMVPSTMISRLVEGAAIGFGKPVKQGSDDKGVVEGIGEGDFLGITVHESGKGQFEVGDEARVMTIGVIWVEAAGTVAAGDAVAYSSGWKKAAASGTGLVNARFETSGGSGDLVQIRLEGTATEKLSS